MLILELAEITKEYMELAKALDDEMNVFHAETMGLRYPHTSTSIDEYKLWCANVKALPYFIKDIDESSEIPSRKTIGFVVLTPGEMKETTWISEFYIKKRYRHKGYGTQALKLIAEQVESTGKSRLLLRVLSNNKPANALYKKAGFDTEITRVLMKQL